jgi:cytochrome c553
LSIVQAFCGIADLAALGKIDLMKKSPLLFMLLSAPIWLCSYARASSARDNFMVNCASCHGSDGRAQTAMGKKLGAKSLIESKLKTAEIEKQISFGAKDTGGVFKMPAFNQRLAREEIAGLAVFVKSLQH